MMRVVVLGGSGFFGRLVVDGLMRDRRFDVLVAGRRAPAGPAVAPFIPIDLTSGDLARCLGRLAPDLLVHCAGPFQPGDHAVAEAALHCGCHYLDLADNRDAMLGVRRFDHRARSAGLVLLSGVSSVPALSSAAVGQVAAELARVWTVDIGITTSERVPGIGTAASVLDQCGQPIQATGDVTAWADRLVVRWPGPVGRRVMSSCNVPDLALLAERFPELRRVTFRGGVASPLIMWGLRRFAGLRRRGWLRQPTRWASPLYHAARWLEPFGNGASGMFVRVGGVDAGGVKKVVWWRLVAQDNQGPLVPAQGAISLAGLIASGRVPVGARPAFMELRVAEYLGDLPVTVRVQRLVGPCAEQEEVQWQAS